MYDIEVEYDLIFLEKNNSILIGVQVKYLFLSNIKNSKIQWQNTRKHFNIIL